MPRSRRRHPGQHHSGQHYPGQPHRPSNSSLRQGLGWDDGRGRRGRRRASAGLAVAAVLLATLVGCSDNADLDPGPSSPPSLTTTPTPTQTPTANPPVVTLAPSAAGFERDPAVTGFRAYLDALFRAYVAKNGELPELAGTATGTILERTRENIRELGENGWSFAGTAKWVVVGVQEIDAGHRRILACEFDSASYFIDDTTGKVAVPVEDRWVADEHWMVLNGERWIAEEAVEGHHSCDGVS